MQKLMHVELVKNILEDSILQMSSSDGLGKVIVQVYI
jgi:hypothetical protein